MPISPILSSLLISGGGGLLNSIFGSDDQFKMSPESRQLFEKYSKQLGQFQGFKPAEHKGILDQIKGSLTDEFAQGSKRSQASQVRRGVFDPGTFRATQAQTKGRFGEAFGKARTGVDLASHGRDFQQKNILRSMLNSLASGQQFVPGQGLPGLEGIGSNISSLLNPQEQQQGSTQALLDLLRGSGNQSGSNEFNSGLQFNPGGLDFRR